MSGPGPLTTAAAVIRAAMSGQLDPRELAFFVRNPTFAQRPVDVRTFVVHETFLNCPEVWPEVRNILAVLFEGSDRCSRFSPFREFVFDAGIGSGKSFIVSCIFSYVAYWLLCLESPQKHFGLAPKSVICLLNTSTTAQQARKVVFGQVKARIDSSPWFYRHGRPDHHVKSELRFPKDIVIFPGSSSETGPIGYNVIVANVDEASFFVETDIKNSASEVFDVLDRRIDSRFGPAGLIAVTSSPRYVDDFTENKFAESRRNPKRILGYRKPTWEMRPDDIAAIKAGDYFELAPAGSDVKVKIPNKYKNAFEKNPSKAWRDFGAFASLTLEAFFDEEEIKLFEDVMKRSNLPTSAVDGRINPEIKPIPGMAYYVHIDLGISRDCCGFALAHAENPEDVVVDLMLRIASARRAVKLREKGEPIDIVIGVDQVDIDEVLGLIYELAGRGFFIARVTFDNFQSVHSRQQLEKNGFLAELLSVDKDTSAYDTLKTVIRSGRFVCVLHEWALHESKRLELVKGKKVDHPPNASKDVMDAAAGAVKSCLEQFDEEAQDEETIVDEESRIDIDRPI